MGYLPSKDTKFSGTETLANLTADSGGAIDLDAATTVTVPTVAGSADSSTNAASTAFVQAVAATLATASYVDAAVNGIDPKASVRLATTGAITLASRTSSALTTAASTLTLDGSAVVNGDRVLVKDTPTGGGASAADQGIFIVSGVGSTVVLTRTSDADTWNELRSANVWVEIGSANADKGYVCTIDDGGTLGTTAIAWVQYNSNAVTAGTGLTKTGDTIDVIGTTNRITANADSIDISSSYVGQSSITTLGTIATGVWNGTDIAVADGGTGASTAATARSNLGAVNIAGDTITGFLLINYASPFLEVRASSGHAVIEADAATGSTAYFAMKANDVLLGALQANATQVNIYGGAGGSKSALQINAATSNVILGNSTGTLTSGATDPAITDSSAKIATTAWVQGKVRHLVVGAIADGSFPLTITASSGIPSYDVVITQQTAGSRAITLPAASSMNAGGVIIIKDGSAAGAGTYNMTINRAGADTIDGLTSFVMTTNAQSINLMSDGSSKWYLI